LGLKETFCERERENAFSSLLAAVVTDELQHRFGNVEGGSFMNIFFLVRAQLKREESFVGLFREKK
jgi:hypothetical protein